MPAVNVQDPSTPSAKPAVSSDGLVAHPLAQRIAMGVVMVVLVSIPLLLQVGPMHLEPRSAAAAAATVVLVTFLVFSVGAFLWRFDSRVWARRRHLFVLGTLVVGMVWVTRLLLWWKPDLPALALPVPLAAMLAALLVGTRAGGLTAVTTTLVGVLLGFAEPGEVAGALSWALASVVAVDFMKDRRSITFVGLFVTAFGAVASVAAALADGMSVGGVWTTAALGGFGGIAASVLGYGLLPFFEYVFNLTTDVRLIELASPAHPLMRELMLKAPGTYSHSVMTGNLAETAAETIGANPVLARVGAYYHDIGKIKRPEFFSENQASGANPHDGTAPSMSALIITAHVAQGIELAEEYKLPREIVAIIRQHHGTSLVSYFFNKAREHEETVYEADFRYTGERPQSREAALVMLADSCEAAVRGLSKPTPPRIEAVVRSVIEGKVADGQLHDSDLTLADIEEITSVYHRMLSNVYHRRVTYPNVTPKGQEHAHPAHESSRS